MKYLFLSSDITSVSQCEWRKSDAE